MWEIEYLITEADDLKEIGAFYLALRFLNQRRVAEKNRISDNYGGHIEMKDYT